MSSRKQPERARCHICDEDVDARKPRVLPALFYWLGVLGLAAVVTSLIAAAHTFADSTVHGPAVVVLWPVAASDGWTHPKASAFAFAFLAFLAIGKMSDGVDKWAAQNLRCPRCDCPVKAAAADAS
ncbi:hypothetical protein [Streptomyces sp. NPDC048663]|uniref:hypothetical protein n=1 Tax=Streptomyces sp. NPDC048663 TaxID=3155638 RepID=UPI00343641E6